MLSFNNRRTYLCAMKWLSTIIIFLTAASVHAQQSLDLLTLSYRQGFEQNIPGTPGKARERVLLGNVKVPIVLSEKTIWYNDLTHTGTTVSYSMDGIDPLKLHGFILQTGIIQTLSENTAIQLLFAPRFMSDYQEINGSHFQFGGLALFEKKHHEGLTLRYGLLFNRNLSGPVFVPLVYVDWLVDTKWSVKGLLPVFGKIAYQANEKLSVGLSHFGLITTYQLGDPAYNGDYIERKSIDLALFGRYKLYNNVHFEARAGYALARSYGQYAKGDEMDFSVTILKFGDDRTQKNTSFDPGPIIDFRLVYNLPIQ